MSYTPLIVERFGGLNLVADPGELSWTAPVDMLNVDVARDRSKLKSRSGLTRLGTGTATYHRIAPLTAAKLVVCRNTGSALSLEQVLISTGVVSSSVTLGGSTTRATSIVGDGANVLVASRSGSSNEITKNYSGSGGSSNYGSIAARYYAVTPWDRRLAAAHYTSSSATPSGSDGTENTIFFSDPGNPLNYEDDNWITLKGGFAEEITGMVAWRELLFVMRETAAYVFYSTGTDSTGGAVFNYRRIELPARARKTAAAAGENIIAGDDGVYMLLADGVYKSSGGVPTLVSQNITPIFNGTADSTMLFPSSSTADWRIGYHSNRFYLSYAAGANQRTLVYDAIVGEWLLWDLSAGQSATPTNVIEWLDANNLPTSYFASGGRIYSFSTSTSDDGTAIVSRYQSGFADVAQGKEAHLRDFDLWGTGTVTHQVATDYGSADAGSSVTLGTAPTAALGFDSLDRMGRLVSFKVGASSGAWSLNRWMARVQGVRDWT